MKTKIKLNIRIDTKSAGLVIYINNLIHLNIRDIEDFIGFQSWINGSNNYVIEYYTKHKTIKCSYNDFKKWKMILEQLNQI